MATHERRRVFTVSRLNQEVQRLLESSFGTLWLQGELSNLARPASGHWYFSLKDSQAQVRCAMFRARARNVDTVPVEGDAVLVRGKLSLYTARGDFQLIVEHLEPAGAGKLQAAFDKTRRELEAAGWFDPEQRQSLPATPDTIGVVTSPTGAAIRDVLQVLKRRYPQATVIIYPTSVQGAQAAPSIVNAITRACQRREVDVLLIVRGGGSLEDLWAFNDVAVARAVRDCPLPIVSGVGHEVDVTITDLVADLRAPTPSAAAELATPDTRALLLRVQEATTRLHGIVRRQDTQRRHHLQALQARLQARHPARRMAERSQRVDELEARLLRGLQQHLNRTQALMTATQGRLAAASPLPAVAARRFHLAHVQSRLHSQVSVTLERHGQRLGVLARALHDLSPLATLERGFAVVTDNQSKVVREVASLTPGDTLTTRLASGTFTSDVRIVTKAEQNVKAHPYNTENT